ncbi:MAG: molybdopterin-guanine dinucleotide biosynthesis protein B [Burkholderiaceae bacterium]|jgi:molybdopterin-guanine dinucleotide biosynthesis protein B|nr:MAG: molybdopterin-guanine dinucleotide biosynthesis protein B [Burkholderiaceae bacterium]
MKVVCFAGYSGSGKTTLIERVIPEFRQRGLRVSTVKHAHHRFDIDYPGKDSYRHRAAGAFEVVVASDRRLALIREFEQETRLSVHALIARLDPCVDWVLAEGFKESDLPKIEVWRAATGESARFPLDPTVLAVATDAPASLPRPVRIPVLSLNDPAGVARWLLRGSERFDYRAS